ncbi:MAG: hypothetical protein KAR05_03810 [Candidatus Omnitrophica bacterium]|nr:hypothetical protein [Candidatus Omnitrophota bacterium]
MRRLNNKGGLNLPLIVFVLFAVILFRMQLEKFFNPAVYRGPWYTVTIPVGWEKKVLEDEVVFLSPELDIYTEMPEALFSIYSKKSDGSLFLGDLFVQVLKELKKSGVKILKQGDVDVDSQRSKWVLVKNVEHELIILTFFIVDDFNRYTKIQFVANPEKFNEYRPAFEEFKGTFKFKRMF